MLKRKPPEFHGLTKPGQHHPLYATWRAMKQRCYCPNQISYPYYGAKGIKVCKRWRDSFVSFLADVGERPGPEYTLDRIKSSGDYKPGNVRWATITKQIQNRSMSRITMEQAREIRKLRAEGWKPTVIARKYGLRYWTVWAITKGHQWKE